MHRREPWELHFLRTEINAWRRDCDHQYNQLARVGIESSTSPGPKATQPVSRTTFDDAS